MKKLINLNSIFAILLIATMYKSASGSVGTVKSAVLLSGDKREMASFEKLELEGAFSVTLIQGNEESVVVSAPGEIESQILTKVENGSLHIYTDKKFKSSEKISLTVYFKELKLIDCSGAIVLAGTGALKFKDLSFDASGACKVNMDISANSLIVNMSGAGATTLTGKVSRVDLDISGAGKFMAAALMADDYEIDISGAGNAEVNAAKNLNVEVSGTGNVKYKGAPSVTKEISGAGSVTKF